MKRINRLGIVELAIALFGLAVIVKAARVQVFQRAQWTAAARQQHVVSSLLPAPRGSILDAAGATLAENRELLQIAVAPRELKDPRMAARRLVAAGVSADWIKRATDTRHAWVEIPGQFLPGDVAALSTMHGVHPSPVVQRVYVPSQGVRRIVGRARPDGNPVDGVELALDSLLRGTRGTGSDLRDALGRRFESPTSAGAPAQPGHTILLTLNHQLQDICERALEDATREMNAEGGDIVVLEPRSGEVLAMASRRANPLSTSSTALTEPYEPGSTLKPFLAAALIAHHLATPDDIVNTFGGTYSVDGRTITDLHKADRMSLAQVIKFSSNIGIVQFASRMSRREEYEALRDFGFGTPTGVSYPSEAAGTLREPVKWSRQSQASMAMGYEIAVTPLQLATAYAALANGGELMEPALVKEVRAPDGKVIYRHERRVVRRVLSQPVAATVRRMLIGVVEGGTAAGADLATFEVGGKSGTARRTAGHGYAAGQYTASFVGLFPADDPQYVILVKLDNPSGTYFGGKTAAPVSRVILQAAIAARDAALDRGALASAAMQRSHLTGAVADIRPVNAQVSRETLSVTQVGSALAARDTEVPVVIDLADPARAAHVPSTSPRPVPDVHGLALRGAVRALHQAGFRVQLSNGERVETAPLAGQMTAPGSVVRLFRPTQ